MDNKNIYLKMNSIKDLSSSERQVVDYILENATQVINLNITELGLNSFTSTGTVSRVYKKLGFTSFTTFKACLIQDLSSHINSIQIVQKKQRIYNDDNVETIIKKMTINSVNALNKVALLNSHQTFQTVVNHMINANQIHMFGSGVSNLICRDALSKGLRSGIKISAHSYYAEMVMQARLAHPNDLAIIVSYTGETEEIIKIAKILQLNKIKMVSITSNTNNSIASLSDINLYVDSGEGFFRVGGMDSRLSMQHVLDILFSIYFSQVKCARESIEVSLQPEDFTNI